MPLPRQLTRRLHLEEPLAAKVPEITVMFWVVKLLTTFLGEVMSDWLGDTNVVVGGVAEAAILAFALWLQFRTRRYRAGPYWLLAAAIATVGTGVSDTLHVATGTPYIATTLFWAVVLALIFWRWHRHEGTLSIHSITTRRREAYYWATVFATFALGTALGDFTASSVGLGYAPSGLMFIGIFLIPLVLWRGFRVDAVLTFWFAYVVTRPLGASFADYVSKSPSISGLGFGDGHTALVAFVAFVVLVVGLGLTRHGVQATAPPASPEGATVGPPEEVGSALIDP